MRESKGKIDEEAIIVRFNDINALLRAIGRNDGRYRKCKSFLKSEMGT